MSDIIIVGLTQETILKKAAENGRVRLSSFGG